VRLQGPHCSASCAGATPVPDDGKLVGMISYIDFPKHYASDR